MKKIFPISSASIIHIISLIFLVMLFFLVRNLPLLATPGFESANFFVALCAPILAFASALHQKRHSYGQIISIELGWLFFFVALLSILLLINGFYLTSCSQGAGFLSFLVVLVPPFLLNVSIGVLFAGIFSRTGVKILMFVLGYGAYYFLIIYCWWLEPNFRLITHGSLLITSDLLKGDFLSPAVIGFRTSTLMLALVVILFGINFLSDQKFPKFNQKTRQPFFCISLIGLILFFQIFLHIKSIEAIGKNRTALKNDYTFMMEADGLRIYADPTKTTAVSVKGMLDEASYFKERIKTQLGTASSEPITIWLHQSEEEKFLYTGAKNVHFALPRHREIHIAGTNIPHEVLGHELAHIYVGELSKTFFGTPGESYVIPHLALTEGLAVMLTKEQSIDNNLTILEQAQALYQADIRLDIEKLFSNNPIYFARSHPRSSYIYSGAALDYFFSDFNEEERHEKIRQLIESGSLDVLFVNDDDRSQKIAAFTNVLSEKVPLYAISWAHKTFPKTSILTSDCSEQQISDQILFREALLNLDMKKIEELIAQTPAAKRALLFEAVIDEALQKGAYPLALIFIEKSEASDRSLKALLMLKNVEALINLGRFKEAWEIIENIDEEALPPYMRRLLAASQIFFRDYFLNEGQPSLGKAALLYLFSRPHMSQLQLTKLTYRLGQETVRREISSPLILMSHYLLARALMHNAEYEGAHILLEPIIKNSFLLPNAVERESMIMNGAVSFAREDFHAALRTFTRLIATSKSPAEKLFLSDQKERVMWKQRRATSN